MALTLLDITVDTKDLRRALTAVVPHASTDADWPELSRVRCHIDRENLTAAATDRYTAALGLCSVWECDELSGPGSMGAADVGSIDFGLEQVKKILAVFKVGRSGDDDSPQWKVRVQLIATSSAESATLMVRLTDMSGLFPGEQLELPALPAHDGAPDIPQMFARWTHRPAAVLDVFGVTGKLISRFKVAAAAYDEPLLMTSVGAPGHELMLVRCSDSFLGAVVPRRFDEDVDAKHKEWLDDWVRRLPVPTGLADLSGVYSADDEKDSDDD
ncbi:hypothetical protein [Gordonia sp. NB41Y]|uniref:hypothetical protein n=1 Tax=Gordonia sp. NB41Y TaxID=875808 RepID=UPI0002BEC04D|nr:hypothetical protein [Gordonia sp. NB41Y]EMP15058.1 hypothetical protein ISGA_47 [Gordonia sp. NB41Y]WLP91339.1 hypothetical protein Q9K23_03445 [Gordonia sp. NB41Y]